MGSNAWAFAPSRTKSGKAILLRNPHLAWTAGYYEAHMTVPGVVDFYGDFRIGGPLIVIGGFNRHLGFATTNSNSGDLSEIYSLALDPKSPDRYLLDGASLPIVREFRTVAFRDGDAMLSETREFLSTPLGPVVHRTDDRIFIVKTAGDVEFRAGEQFLRMMRARSLAEWKDAMKMRALVTSNYTYADAPATSSICGTRRCRNCRTSPAATGRRPSPACAISGRATFRSRRCRSFTTRAAATSTTRTTRRTSRTSASRSGPTNAYPNIEPPMLRLRSQHAIQLIDTNRKVSLEDVVRLKHSYRMLLADRVKTDLLAAVKATKPPRDVADAAELLRRWDNTAAPESRGATLFEVWFGRYAQGRQDAELFAHPWSVDDPLKTPRGLSDPARAAEAFAWAVEETAQRYGRWDVTWGDVHRVRRGTVDVPVGGCTGRLGCFRVLSYGRDPDGKLVANTGDGWVLAVEFSETPRAYSVLAYGQSPRPESPWHADQAAMFARGEMKRVAFTPRDVEAQVVTRYRPGER